ncbi:hypothetical protein AcdelDRAFT_3664, partial [Acidovorax delafieldii 2AN]
ALLPGRHGALAVQWGAVLAWYGAAKLFEAADHAVFEATGQWVSGHSLKHLLAAGAALPVLAALDATRAGAGGAGAARSPCAGRMTPQVTPVARRTRCAGAAAPQQRPSRRAAAGPEPNNP